MNALDGVGLRVAGKTVLSSGSSDGVHPANMSDTALFESLLDDSATGDSVVSPVNLGDTMLASIDRFHSGIQREGAPINTLMTSKSVDVVALLKVQQAVHHINMQYSLASKVVGKFVQGIEQLFKMQ